MKYPDGLIVPLIYGLKGLMVVERNKDLKAMYRVFHPNQVTADKKFAEWMEKRKTAPGGTND